MHEPPPPGDPRRCPLCGEANRCGMAEGATSCWCFGATIAPETLAGIPAESRGKTCICSSCAAATALTPPGDLVRNRE